MPLHPLLRIKVLIQAKIANMAASLGVSRLLTYKATIMIDNKIPCMKGAFMAKYFAAEAACSAAEEASRIFEAYGWSLEYMQNAIVVIIVICCTAGEPTRFSRETLLDGQDFSEFGVAWL